MASIPEKNLLKKIMINYIVYIVIFIILILVANIAIKAINRGIKAKQKLNKDLYNEKYKNNEKD